MPQERDHNYPFPTAEDVEAAPGSRAVKAARNIMVRHIRGIPRRAFLSGENDPAPVVRGVLDLTEAVYRLIDELDTDGVLKSPEAKAALNDLDALLDHHGCPKASEVE